MLNFKSEITFLSTLERILLWVRSSLKTLFGSLPLIFGCSDSLLLFIDYTIRKFLGLFPILWPQTPRHASRGRGSSDYGGNREPYGSGLNSYVLAYLRNLLNDWEAEMAVQHLVGQQTQVQCNHYWIIRNMLDQVLMRSHNSEGDRNALPPPYLALDIHSSPSPSPSLLSKPMET